jgi:predicted phosphodiesterase
MQDNKIAIISDVHSNYEALASVISHAHSQGVSDVWFLGDAVGYGPDPHRCLKLLQETIAHPDAWVLGNHDEAMRYPPNGMELVDMKRKSTGTRCLQTQVNPIIHCIGSSPDTFNAFRINYEILDAFPERRNFLLSHHATSRMQQRFFLVHGGIRSGTPATTYTIDRVDAQNEFWLSIYKVTAKTLKKLKSEKLPGHIYQTLESMENQEIIGEDKFLDLLQTMTGNQSIEEYKTVILQHAFLSHRRRFHDIELGIFLFGHTHQPVCFKGINQVQQTGKEKIEFFAHDLKREKIIQLDDRHAWFFNPGSVGQPRDGDPRASYLIFNKHNDTMQLHRVEYNIRAAQKQMESYRLPTNFIQRLSLGR